MADNGKEDDWEYASEDGEDYSWEYSDEEGEDDTKGETKDIPINNKVDTKDIQIITKEETKEIQIKTKEETIESPISTKEDCKKNSNNKPIDEEPAEVEDIDVPREKLDRNAIMEQMKRLQESYNNAEVDMDDCEDSDEYSLSDSDEQNAKPKKKEAEEEEKDEEELDLEDMDLLDPFGSEPVPVVKKDPPQNGHGKETGKEGDKKHRKHRKKSKHSDKFEKFKNLEEKDNEDKEGEFRSKKIHVRSKDPMKIARQFEKGSGKTKTSNRDNTRKTGPRPPPLEINKICKVCGKEPYLVERLVAEKSWWHKNCFRCTECNKTLSLDTYASHQGVIYCKPHQRDLFKPKAVLNDLTDQIIKKNIDFSVYDVEENVNERHKRQERKMETIVRENKPVDLPGVIKGKVDDSKWDGLDKLDVGTKFMMFEKAGSNEDKEKGSAGDRYGIMDKLKRLQEGENVTDLLAEIDDEMPSDEEDGEDLDDDGLTEVQKKAHNAEKLFNEESKKERLAEQRKKEIKKLREKLMAGTRDSVLDSFDELNHRKIKKTQVDVRGANAKKFMNMFNNGEVPEGNSASDRTTVEKDSELEVMRSKKRGERDFFKKMESNGGQDEAPKEPKLLIGKLKTGNGTEGLEIGDPECATLSKKFSFFENYDEDQEKKTTESKVDLSQERMHSTKECKASSVLSKFKDMEKRVANGEETEDQVRNRPLKRFTPPRKLGEESGSDYSGSDYTDSEYSDSEDYSSDSISDKEGEENEYLRNVREAARAKQLRAKFEEWEASLGEDGGYTNLVDENGLPLETASKLKNRFEQLAVEEPSLPRGPAKKFQVKRFKPKEAYENQGD